MTESTATAHPYKVSEDVATPEFLELKKAFIAASVACNEARYAMEAAAAAYEAETYRDAAGIWRNDRTDLLAARNAATEATIAPWAAFRVIEREMNAAWNAARGA